MVHDYAWLGRARIMHRKRLTASIGLLLACMLLLGLPASASATSSPEMRGEWELVVNTPQGPAKGIALITTEADGLGKFSASSVLFEKVVPGTFSGTLEGATASVKVTTEEFGQLPANEFVSNSMTVTSSGSSLSMSGSGELTSTTKSGSTKASASLVATRLKTQKQIEEQKEREAREKTEHEEQEARENIRGEWSLVVKAGPQTINGVAVITATANSKNEFTSAGALFESVDPGTFSGTLEGSKASVEVTSEAYGPLPPGKFTSTTMTIESKNNTLSISGSGTLTSGTTTIPGATLLATRIKTYGEVVAREAKEKQEKEAKEKVEREAEEKAALEAKEKTEREAKEKAEREIKEKQAKEVKEKTEREAKEKAEREANERLAKEADLKQSATLISAEPTTKTFSVASSGALSLGLANPNEIAIQGHITLSMTVSSKAHKGKAKALSLGTGSFSLSAKGKQTVKISLSHSGRTELARHKTLRVQLKIVTDANGKPNVSKTYTLTLRAAHHH